MQGELIMASRAQRTKKYSTAGIKKLGMSKGKYVIVKPNGHHMGSKKDIDIRIYPMLPKGFTASQRRELKNYEKSLYSGKCLDWNF